MKNDTLLIIGAAVAGVLAIAYLTRAKPKTGSVTAGPLTQASGANGVYEIFNTALPGQPGWAWRYYSDGTSIDPQGNYYTAGNLVWKATP